MAVKYGSGPQPVAHSAKRCFLNCLETSLRPSIRPPSCTASKAPLKGRSRRPKPHGSEVRIGPAAGSPYCQTLLSELPRNLSQTFHSPAFLHCYQSSAQRTVSQSQNTMAVKYGSGPRPAAHTAKRCFLNCLETSLRPSIRPPSCIASKAPLKGPVSQSQNTMAVKYGSGPQPVAHSAKRCFLNCLETSLRPSIRPPSCTASKAPLKGRSRRTQTPWQ